MTSVNSIERGLVASAVGIAANVCLAFIKIVVGFIGNSDALIADGIESSGDVVSSLVVWGGLKVSTRPPDENHPYGHGKAEALAALVVAGALLSAATLIGVGSIKEIGSPHSSPAWFTLPVLLGTVLIKWFLSRYVEAEALALNSSALKGDASHHFSDAITSAVAFIGITVGLIGGKGYETADDWAALLTCVIITYNGLLLFWQTSHELMDAAGPEDVKGQVAIIAKTVSGVHDVEKCWVRKYGMGYVVDLHLVVDGDITVREGHKIAHQVKYALQSGELRIADALIHVEPLEIE